MSRREPRAATISERSVTVEGVARRETVARDEFVERALRAYGRRFGRGSPQPSRASLKPITGARGRVFVVLSNLGGELARYQLTRGRLRFVASEDKIEVRHGS